MQKIDDNDPFELVFRQTKDIVELSLGAQRMLAEGSNRNVLVESLLAAIQTRADGLWASLQDLQTHLEHYRAEISKTAEQPKKPSPRDRKTVKHMTKHMILPNTAKKGNRKKGSKRKLITLENPAAFGIRIKTRRDDLGWSCHELARRAGITRSGIQSVERGINRQIRQTTLAKLATALRVKEAELLDGSVFERTNTPPRKTERKNTQSVDGAQVAAHQTGYDLEHFYETGERVPKGAKSSDSEPDSETEMTL